MPIRSPFPALVVALGLLAAGGCSEGEPGRPEQIAPNLSGLGVAEPSLQEAVEITRAFGEVLQKTPTDGGWIYGTTRLPEPKARIRAALLRVLASAAEPKEVETLKAAVLRLAYFQEGVQGTADLAAVAPDGRRYRQIVEAELSEAALEMARRGYGAPPGQAGS